MIAKNLRRIETLEHRAGINALTALSDAEIIAEMVRLDHLMGSDAPPPELTLRERIAWLECALATVH